MTNKADKQEFNVTLDVVRRHSMARLEVIEAFAKDERANRTMESIKEHDPYLHALICEAEYAAAEPLRRLLRYIGQRTDN